MRINHHVMLYIALWNCYVSIVWVPDHVLLSIEVIHPLILCPGQQLVSII